MSLRLFASQSLAAAFVATLVFGSAPASADEGPLLRRPMHRHHHHHFHHRLIQPTVQYQPSCHGCGTHVVARPIERPVYASTCGCGGHHTGLHTVAPIVETSYIGRPHFHRHAVRWHHPWLRPWHHGQRHVGIR
jgi:hypothetical protein